MPKLKYDVALPIKDYEDALKKVQQFVKHGFVDDVAWNNNSGHHQYCSHVVVHAGGEICVFNHKGCSTVAILSRVRDVEQHYAKINTSVCLKVHSFTHWLELQFDLEAMGYVVDTAYSESIIASKPRFKGLYLHIEPDFTACLHTHTLGSEVQPNFEYIVNELPQRPKGK